MNPAREDSAYSAKNWTRRQPAGGFIANEKFMQYRKKTVLWRAALLSIPKTPRSAHEILFYYGNSFCHEESPSARIACRPRKQGTKVNQWTYDRCDFNIWIVQIYRDNNSCKNRDVADKKSVIESTNNLYIPDWWVKSCSSLLYSGETEPGNSNRIQWSWLQYLWNTLNFRQSY